MIYENNYFYGIKNNLIEGQGLVPSFIQSLLLEIGFHSQNFVFIQSLSNIFIFWNNDHYRFKHYDKKQNYFIGFIYSIFTQ